MVSSMPAGRSRHGCQPCRRRHLKCDEQRPSCGLCERRDETCNYSIQLIWPEGSSIEGQSHRRSIESHKKGEIPSLDDKRAPGARRRSGRNPIHIIHTTTEDVARHMGSIGSISKTVTHSPRFLYLQPSQPSELCYNEALISFYDTIICSTSTFVDNRKHNPYRDVFIPMALRSPGVLYGLLAISARILSFRDRKYYNTALQCYSHSLNHLVLVIEELSKSNSGIEEACALSVLLCWFEISSDRGESWISHLTGLLHFLVKSQTADGSAIPPFFARYFLFHLVLAKTALSMQHLETILSSTSPPRTGLPNFSNGADHCTSEIASTSPCTQTSHAQSRINKTNQWANALSLWTGDDAMLQINLYTGLSDELLLLIDQIADLRVVCSKEELLLHNRNVKLLQATLEGLQQRLPGELDHAAVLQASACAETYRLATLVFLHHKDSYICSRIGWRTTMTSPLLTETEIDELGSQILELLERNPSLLQTAAIPLWPLFMTGCSAADECLRARVLDIFSSVEDIKRFGNVTPTRRIVEKIWRQRDLSADERPASIPKYQGSQRTQSLAEERQKDRCVWDYVTVSMERAKTSLT